MYHFERGEKSLTGGAGGGNSPALFFFTRVAPTARCRGGEATRGFQEIMGETLKASKFPCDALPPFVPAKFGEDLVKPGNGLEIESKIKVHAS